MELQSTHIKRETRTSWAVYEEKKSKKGNYGINPKIEGELATNKCKAIK